jgi:hypothetical protein
MITHTANQSLPVSLIDIQTSRGDELNATGDQRSIVLEILKTSHCEQRRSTASDNPADTNVTLDIVTSSDLQGIEPLTSGSTTYSIATAVLTG